MATKEQASGSASKVTTPTQAADEQGGQVVKTTTAAPKKVASAKVMPAVKSTSPKKTTATASSAVKPAAKPVVAKPAATKPVAVKSAVAKPATAKPATAKPAAAKPAAAKPAAAKPAAAKPAAAKPAAAKPAAAKPAAAKPATTKPATTKPAARLESRAHTASEQSTTTQTASPLEEMQSMFKDFSQSNQLMGVWQQFADKLSSMGGVGMGLPGGNPSSNLFGNMGGQAADFAKMVSPEDLQRLQSEYMREMATLWQNYIQQQGFEITDKRFSSAAWRSNAWANYLAQSYLINARLMLEMAECVKADAKTKTRVRFAIMQWVDSLAPSNFFVTNPDAQQKLIDTQGESLKMGINNFLTDLQKGRISQTDETAFEIGVNVARSDGAVIFENDYFQLLQYTPLTEQVSERPLLIVPPCINKYYIMDLQPDNSLVRHAVEAGNTVYLVSWRNADESMAQITWDDYVEDVVIRAIHVVQDASGQEQINVLGFCVGGTLLSTALAVLKARGEPCVASLTLLTALLDFSDNGVLDAYVDEQQVMMREQSMAKGGVVQGKELANAFATLRPNDLVWNYVVSNYLKGEQPTAFDLLYWNSDSTNLPGPMFCWYLRNTYLENRLVNKGDVICCGERIDLSSIDVPTYVLSCREDHIVPWTAAFRSQQALSGNKRFVLAASGHIAGVINSAKKNKRNFWINPTADLAGSSEAWLESAEERPGSWWNDWTAWLKTNAGADVKAPNKLGTSKYKPIEVAPGRYVKARAA